MKEPIYINTQWDSELKLKVIPGHFTSDRFHMNYYVDLTHLKTRQQEAEQVAKAMCQKYINGVQLTNKSNHLMSINMDELQGRLVTKERIDTIVCLDGCEVIGAYVAHELSEISDDKLGFTRKKNFNVISPEYDNAGQMVVQDNIKPMFTDKNVLIVMALAMSGNTILKSIRAIESYGGTVVGVSVIFGAVEDIDGHPVHAVFDANALPDFALSEPDHCTDCHDKVKIDAIVNNYGYTII